MVQFRWREGSASLQCSR